MYDQGCVDAKRLLASISAANSAILQGLPSVELFTRMLEGLIRATDSAFGFMGEVLRDEHDAPYLRTHAITDIAWDRQSEALYASMKDQGMEFRNLDTLFGRTLATGEPVLTNHPWTDPRAGGLPRGHPQLLSYLGLPVTIGSEMVAMVGLANRKGGFSHDMIRDLEPFLVAYGTLISAFRTKSNLEAALALTELNQQRLDEAQAATRIGSWEYDVTNDRLFWSNQTFLLFGYEPLSVEPSLNRFLAHVHPDDREMVTSLLDGCLRTTAPIDDFDYLHRILVPGSPSGDFITMTIRCRGRCEKDAAGDAKLIVGTSQDVTDDEEKQLLFKVAFDKNPKPLIIVSETGKLVEANNLAISEVFEGKSYNKGTKINHNTMTAFEVDSVKYFKENIKSCLRTNKKIFFNMASKKSDLLRYEVSLSPIISNKISGMVVCEFSDVSKTISEVLEGAGKLKQQALGQVAAGVAHDFNNYLGIILGNLDLLKRMIGSNTELGTIVDDAISGCESAAEIVSTLLVFSKPIPARAVRLSLKSYMEKFSAIASRVLGSIHNVDIHLDEGVHDVFGDPVLLETALVNLLLNAKDAMPNGGGIDIFVKAYCNDDEFIESVEEISNFVDIVVADGGEGIDESCMDRVFDPYFTTKENSTNSGLGLSIVYGIVTGMAGSILIDSERGVGTKITLRLPLDYRRRSG